MEYCLDPSETVQEGLRRVAREQLDLALAEIADPQLDVHLTVHQLRKRCKKVRALSRLVRGVWASHVEVNAALRDAARRVSELRDAKVRVDTFDAVLAEAGSEIDAESLAPVRAALVAERDDLLRRHDREERRLDLVRGDLETIRAGIASWVLDAQAARDTVQGTLAAGFEETQRSCHQLLEDALANPTGERFHEWRKRAKDHREQVDLLAAVSPQPEDRHLSLHQLTDLLGIANDLGELLRADAALGAGGAEQGEKLRSLIERRRAQLWQQAAGLADLIYAEATVAAARA